MAVHLLPINLSPTWDTPGPSYLTSHSRHTQICSSSLPHLPQTCCTPGPVAVHFLTYLTDETHPVLWQFTCYLSLFLTLGAHPVLWQFTSYLPQTCCTLSPVAAHLLPINLSHSWGTPSPVAVHLLPINLPHSWDTPSPAAVHFLTYLTLGAHPVLLQLTS